MSERKPIETQNVIVAGFGGQGVMSIGMMLAYAGMHEGREVSYLPSYGPEMRGGTANCNVVVSDQPVASPVVTEATAAIVMNLPSLDKFEASVRPGKALFINASLIHKKATRTDIEVFYVPANEIAMELGNARIANMVMLGAYLAYSGVVSFDSVLYALRKVLGESKAKFIPVNEQALKRGEACVLSRG